MRLKASPERFGGFWQATGGRRLREIFRIAGRAGVLPVLLAGSLCGCAPAEPGAPYSLSPRLPYAACGDMAGLRAKLTGNRDLSRQSDAILQYLGVRCLGDLPPGRAPVRARY